MDEKNRQMETQFVKAFTRFAVAVAIIAAIVLIAVGAAVLLIPEMVFTVLVYVLGGICLISGIALIGSLLAGLLR